MTITDPNGCVINETVEVYLSTGIEGLDASLNVEFYPNPFVSTAVLNFDVQAAGDVEMNIFDVLGRNAVSTTILQGQGSITVGEDLEAGVYFLQFTNAAGNLGTVKITKL